MAGSIARRRSTSMTCSMSLSGARRASRNRGCCTASACASSSVPRAALPALSNSGCNVLSMASHISSATGRSVRVTVSMVPRRPGHPRRDLADVADRRGEADQANVARRLDDQLLPHGAARVVVDVVHLVEHDVADPIDARGLVVEHVAQDLRGHHQDRRAVVERVLAGDQADAVLAEALAEVVILLVAQRFQWCRVDDVGRIGDRPSQRGRRVEAAPDHVVGDDRLAARRRRAHQHAA